MSKKVFAIVIITLCSLFSNMKALAQTNKISIQIEDNESIIKIEICHPKKINIDNLYLICYIIHYHTQTEEVFSWGDEYLQSMLEQLP